MKNALLTKVTGIMGKTGLKLKKYSPEIFITVGIIGTVASTVLACKATTKLSGILDETKGQLDTIHKCSEKKEMTEIYTPDDAKKDTAIVYVQTGAKLAKLYAPAVILGALSIASIVASNGILKKRNAALAAAYVTVDTSFKQYRNRVKDRFGETIDKELRYGLKAETISKTSVDENGNEVTTEETIYSGDPNFYSDYARIFDESNPNWEKDSDYNFYFLKGQQEYMNNLLRSRGYLFLNEVYEALGFPITKAGQVVGWLYRPDNPIGDNYVDFGIFNLQSEKACDFVNGYERSIILDFNVDGNIYDLM